MMDLSVFFIALILLPCLWALTGIALDARPFWRRITRAAIGAGFLADLALLVAVVVDFGGHQGCPFNGCS